MGDNMSKRLKLVSATEAEMEERSFVNPYPDCDQGVLTSSNSSTDSDSNELFDANGKISEAFQKRVQNKIKDLLQQIEEGLKTADPHDFSTYTGWTGIALLYLQLHRVTCEASHLQRALDYVKRTLRNLNGRRVTFLCGDAGPLAVAAVVHHRLSNHTDSQDCIAKLLQLQRAVLSPDSEVPDELLYGRAGYLYALLYVNKEISPNTVDEGTITKVVTAIVESGKNLSSEEKKTERCPLLYEWHKKQYVGAAHGLAGIYYMLMQVFKEEKYLKEAQECGEVIWQRGLLRKGYGLCHGTAGNGYTFLSLYRLTQDRKHLYRACKFAEWCLDYGTHGCRIPDRPYSLFEGSNFISTFQPDNMNLFLAFSPQISLTVDTSTPLSLRMFWFQQRGFAHHGRLPPVTE
ncbi:lanC-like protein 2 isoform X6 [Osmerus mordax]|uniref:lanC-like protein 2 isoform X6 n=1 Tax=Osmerus mordax TaxID=8014 RepID=UPI00350FB223